MKNGMNNRPVTAMSIKMVVKITSYEAEQICGTLDSIYFKEPLVFEGVVSMIELMETTFDTLGFPDKALLPRTFGKAKERMRRYEIEIDSLRESLEKLLAERAVKKDCPSEKAQGSQSEAVPSPNGSRSGTMATFEIFVNFRHNAEWQGRLHWVDQGARKDFSSIVEMVRLIGEALKGG